MRTFGLFMALFAAGIAAMALFAYPAWWLLTPQLDVQFHRVASRIGMLALLVGFVLLARRLGLADRTSLGYGLPRNAFWRELGIGLVLGVAMMLPAAAIMYALDLRMLKPGVEFDATTLASLLVKGLVSGLAVAFIEETFLRGAMHTGIARESGARLAVLLTALLYSATHFLGRYKIPSDQVGPGSGLEVVVGSLRAFSDFGSIIDAFLCLAAVGVLLGYVRVLTGNIAACIGLHAGWVWVITCIRQTSKRDPDAQFAFLVSDFDGVVGWLLLGWTLVIACALVRYYGRRTVLSPRSAG